MGSESGLKAAQGDHALGTIHFTVRSPKADKLSARRSDSNRFGLVFGSGGFGKSPALSQAPLPWRCELL
jgi:hypothetical protein